MVINHFGMAVFMILQVFWYEFWDSSVVLFGCEPVDQACIYTAV